MDIVITSALASFILLLLLGKTAFHVGLVDRPCGRKQHRGDTPVVGGLAMFFGMAATVAMHDLLGKIPPVLLLGSATIVATGALDDRYGLSARLRICIQALVAMCTGIAMGYPVAFIDGVASGRFELGVIAWPVTVIIAVGIFNAFNLMDGMDGLAGGMALVAAVAISSYSGFPELAGAKGLLALLVASLLPFLFFNLGGGGAANKIFLGDAGSVLIGYLIVWSLIESCQGATPVMSTSDALWVCTLPVYDTLAVMMQRIARSASPFLPDRQHIHHLLLALGLSKASVLGILILLALIFMFIGRVAGGVGAGFSLVSFVLMFIVYGVARWWCWHHVAQVSARRMPRAG